MVISSCCNYFQLHLRIGPRGMVFGNVKQSTIYAKFGKSSCKKVFKKQKIIPWLTDHDDVINIAALPAPGRHFLLGPGAADCAPTPLVRTSISRKEIQKEVKLYVIDFQN